MSALLAHNRFPVKVPFARLYAKLNASLLDCVTTEVFSVPEVQGF